VVKTSLRVLAELLPKGQKCPYFKECGIYIDNVHCTFKAEHPSFLGPNQCSYMRQAPASKVGVYITEFESSLE